MTLVLLPGTDGTGDLFAAFIAALGTDFNIQVVRYPTHELLDYLELEKLVSASLPKNAPFVLLGESFSGPIAVALAASSPAQLKGVILCCSFVRNPVPLFSGLSSLVKMLPLGLVPMRVISNLLFGHFTNQAHRNALSKAMSQVSATVLKARLSAVLSANATEKLSRVKVPVLYLRASQDRLVPRSASDLVSKFLPTVRVAELNAPHFLLQAVPVEAAKVVGSFVRECCNSPQPI